MYFFFIIKYAIKKIGWLLILYSGIPHCTSKHLFVKGIDLFLVILIFWLSLCSVHANLCITAMLVYVPLKCTFD